MVPRLILALLAVASLGGCVAYPAPYYGGGYYRAPPVYVAPAPRYYGPGWGYHGYRRW